MVTMHFLTCAVLEYIDNLPVLFVINLFNILNEFVCGGVGWLTPTTYIQLAVAGSTT